MSEPDGFDDAWLALREPADERARDAAGIDDGLKDALDAGGERAATRVLDLGSGTGANLRRLAPRLGHGQRWTLVDHDAALLDRLETRLGPWAERHGAALDVDDDAIVVRAAHFDVRVRRRHTDLATALDTLPFAATDLVTGSALLDLAGADWLDDLARLVADNGCAVLFALSYDGRTTWSPPLDDDRAVHERFDRHQRTDKGLGTSLGPDAAARFAERLGARGLAVSTPRSDWTLGPDDAALQRELLTGLARAAAEIDPAFADRAERWLEERLARVDDPKASLVVGHVEVFAPRAADRPANRPSWLDADGRVVRWPKRAADKRAVLERLVEGFAPGAFHDESEVNAIIRERTVDGDTALLRRELCVAGLLVRRRDGSRYHRAD